MLCVVLIVFLCFYVLCLLYAPSHQKKFQVGVNLLGNKSNSDSDSDTGKWGKVQDWRLLADLRSQLQVPKHIVVTAMRPDGVLFSKCDRIVYFIELTIPFEDVIEEAFQRLNCLWK